MHNNKISIRKKEIKPNGDIIIDDYYFHKCNWSQLVPKLCAKFEDTLMDILVGESWKCLISSSNYINVKRITDRERNQKHELLHYRFFVIVNGKWIDETKLILNPNINDMLLERLSALVMISLHGLGMFIYIQLLPYIGNHMAPHITIYLCFCETDYNKRTRINKNDRDSLFISTSNILDGWSFLLQNHIQ